MSLAGVTATAGKIASPSASSPQAPRFFSPVPQRMVITLKDNAVAIGLFLLIVRLYRISKEPVPLSITDVLKYDPVLKSGAVDRAFRRLLLSGWLIRTKQPGMKSRYTPTWGRVKGTPVPM